MKKHPSAKDKEQALARMKDSRRLAVLQLLSEIPQPRDQTTVLIERKLGEPIEKVLQNLLTLKNDQKLYILISMNPVLLTHELVRGRIILAGVANDRKFFKKLGKALIAQPAIQPRNNSPLAKLNSLLLPVAGGFDFDNNDRVKKLRERLLNELPFEGESDPVHKVLENQYDFNRHLVGLGLRKRVHRR